MIEFYTDGSARAKTNDGGYGVVVIEDNQTLLHAYQEQDDKVTNNQMELEAIIYACHFADKYFPDEKVIIYSDSAYCVNAINDWMQKWASNGWINSKKEPVKNLDLMTTLYSLFYQDFYHCEVRKVSGHNSNLGNELADALATHNEAKFMKFLQDSSLKIHTIDI